MRKIIILFFISISNLIIGQTTTVIEKANQLGNEWEFEKAINLLENEIKNDPYNAELYYWLGRYSHYIVYDTRPFSNKSNKWSNEQVLNNLKKAVELNPDYGDAKYFLAAEYGARALEALKQKNSDQYKKELSDAYELGGFPLHAIEHGKNILKSCDTNSILIVNGDAQFNVIQYVQTIEGYRKDVSLIVLALLERPYYIKLIRDGLENILKPVPINLNDNLIMEMHNYKWKENDIIIPISEKARRYYDVNDSINNFRWTIKPNIGKNKLWTGTAMLINIIETNNWDRSIHYTWFGFGDLDGLGENMQIVGLTARITPMKVKGSKNEYDIERFELLMFDPENYKDYKDIADNNQPRVSYTFGNLSRRRIVDYANYLLENNEKEKAKLALEKMNELMPDSFHPLTSDIEADLLILKEKIKSE